MPSYAQRTQERQRQANVHNELIIETSPEYAQQVTVKLKQCMIDGFLDIFPGGEALTHNLIDVAQGNKPGTQSTGE